MPTSDGVVAQRFEPLEGDHIVHFGVSRKRVARFTSGSDASLPKPGIPPIGYFAFTLDVMEVITLDAILNCSLRSPIPWRRAIQSKSV